MWTGSRCRFRFRRLWPQPLRQGAGCQKSAGSGRWRYQRAGRRHWLRRLAGGGVRALVEKTCGTGCHSIDVVTSQRMSGTEWNAVVETMAARGAQASDAEVKLIVEYLAKTLGREEAQQ